MLAIVIEDVRRASLHIPTGCQTMMGNDFMRNGIIRDVVNKNSEGALEFQGFPLIVYFYAF